jgi:hypothetical protein
MLNEVGPYGYKKSTYKYNVTFNPNDDSDISFQEYVELKYQSDPLACRKNYFRIGRAEGQVIDPCTSGMCDCRDQEEIVTVANPLFLRTIKEESAPKILSQLSGELFADTKKLLDNDFIVAVKSHMVHTALQEIYLFRLNMQTGKLLNASFTNLRVNNSLDALATIMNATATGVTYPASCGLGIFNINSCPFLRTLPALRFIQGSSVNPFKPSDSEQHLYPSIKPLLISTNNISFLNLEYGLPAWIGLTYHYGFLDFNFAMGYTMADSADFELLADKISTELAISSFGVNYASISPKIKFASTLVVRSIAYWLVTFFLKPYRDVLIDLVYKEWTDEFTPVACDPLGRTCMWQFGYMSKFRGNKITLSQTQIKSLIDTRTVFKSNPNNVLYDGNMGPYYNTYTYCTKVYFPDVKNTNCTDTDHTKDDALTQVPSGLWGVDFGFDNFNRTLKKIKYDLLSQTTKTGFFLLGCNVSSLQYEVYPSITTFHDQFIVKYLNKNADPLFTHRFSIDRFEELAWAQYGGGFVTHALLNVRTTFQIIRNGMWRYGDPKYYSAMIEFSSWCIMDGFPNFFIYDINDAKILMDAFARNGSIGRDFRAFIVQTGTTLVGMYIYICIYLYMCIYIYILIGIPKYIQICKCIYIYTYINIHIYIHRGWC